MFRGIFLVSCAVSLALLIALGQPIPHAAAQQGAGTLIMLEGELDVIHADDFQRGRSDTFFFLRDLASGEVFELEFERPPGRLISGTRVTIRGQAVGRRVQVTDLVAAAGEAGGDENLGPLAEAEAPGFAERRAVVLMVDLLDAKASSNYTLDQIAQSMFTGLRSVDGLYREGSYGQLGFPGDTDGDGSADVFGPFSVSYYGRTCDFYSWAVAADGIAQAMGVDLSLYQHRVYVLPRHNDTACTWAGAANVGCDSYCRAWIAEGESPMVYAHELGHNLSMAHAATDPENDGQKNSEYGDYSDPMGLSRSWHVFNAPHADQLAWFDAFPGSVATVVASGLYDIAPIETDPATALDPLVLKIDKPDTDEFYYLSYRQPVGYDDSLASSYTQGVNVHRYRGAGYSRTYLIVSLADREFFEDAINGITVTQLSHGPERVTVEISFGSGPSASCTPGVTTVSLSPSAQYASPGDTLTYAVTVTNTDSSGCKATTLDLSARGNGLDATVTPASLTLSAGASGTASLVITTQGAADGSYRLEVETFDADGLDPAQATAGLGAATAVVDATPPSTPTGLTYAANKNNQAQLSWQEANDTGSGVALYRVYRNGAQIGMTGNTGYSDSNFVEGTVYTARAEDRVSNLSAESDPAVDSGGSSPGKGKGWGKGGKPK